MTYTGVDLADVVSLTQDSIFSAHPQDGPRTGIFIGGKNAEDALDMVDRAKKAFVPPFANHIFADPAGSFTTGAAMVAESSRRGPEISRARSRSRSPARPERRTTHVTCGSSD